MSKDLKEKLHDMGLDHESDLDSIVHDAASQLGSDANNGGLDAQLYFLTDVCKWTDEDILKAVDNA